jgi:hypothetical protein
MTGPTVPMPLLTQVPVGRLMIQAQQQAASSRARLEEDVAALDRYNKDVNQLKDRINQALEGALEENPASGRKAWIKWWSELVATTTNVPLNCEAVQPQTADQRGIHSRAMVPSFGAETAVWSISGFVPIESLHTGDQILTQDTATGALSYTAVLTTRRPASQPAKSILFRDGSIVATDLERFWVAGKGWVMALNLKPGDNIRALGGVVAVMAVQDTENRPTYNIQIAVGRGILVGERGILAHDERVAAPCAVPFDAATNMKTMRPDH